MGEIHAARVAMEQKDAKFLFESRCVTAQRRLGDSQARGGFTEAAIVGNGGEVSQLAKVHREYALFFIDLSLESSEIPLSLSHFGITIIPRRYLYQLRFGV
jgi:hypothetical protein